MELTIGGALEGYGPEGPPGLGPTFTCILKEQFLRTRVGDRFFFERGNQPSAFTAGQLKKKKTKKNISELFFCRAIDRNKEKQFGTITLR